MTGEDVQEPQHGRILRLLQHRRGQPGVLGLLEIELDAEFNQGLRHFGELLCIGTMEQDLAGLQKGDDLLTHTHGYGAFAEASEAMQGAGFDTRLVLKFLLQGET